MSDGLDGLVILYRCDTRTMLTIMLLSLGLGYSYNIAIAVPSLIFIIIAAVNSQDRWMVGVGIGIKCSAHGETFIVGSELDYLMNCSSLIHQRSLRFFVCCQWRPWGLPLLVWNGCSGGEARDRVFRRSSHPEKANLDTVSLLKLFHIRRTLCASKNGGSRILNVT